MDLMDPCRCSSDARGELQGRISDVEEGRFGVVALSCLQMSAKLGRASGMAAAAGPRPTAHGSARGSWACRPDSAAAARAPS